MRQYFKYIFIISFLHNVNAQDSDSLTGINKLFNLTLDSIEQEITLHKWGSDTISYLHLQVQNISTDTLWFKTNSCFYYNHSTLIVDDLKYDLNPDGDCYVNRYYSYDLAPNESIFESQWIISIGLNNLKNGDLDVLFSIPIVKDDQLTYRVDGRSFVKTDQYLIYRGKVKVVKKVIDNRKRKKKKYS